MVCLAYVLPINLAFGTRDVIFVHFGVCAMPFGCLLILWAELRRYFVIPTI
jgi:sodium/potassium-transporting ATPase subunit alpha